MLEMPWIVTISNIIGLTPITLIAIAAIAGISVVYLIYYRLLLYCKCNRRLNFLTAIPVGVACFIVFSAGSVMLLENSTTAFIVAGIISMSIIVLLCDFGKK